MGLFDLFTNQNNSDEKINNDLEKQKLLEKIEFKDKIIIKLEKDLDNRNNEIKRLKEEVENLKEKKDISDSTTIEEVKKDKLESPKSDTANLNTEAKNDSVDKITEMRNRLVSLIKEKTKTKSYHITPIEITDGDIFMSKFGGLGYWDNNMEYPKDSDGNQLILLAQINFDKDKFDTPNLPSKGLLQFYISPNDTYGKYDNPSKNTYKVVYHENVNYDVKKEDLANIKTNMSLDGINEAMPFDKEFKIEFEETYDYMNSSSVYFRDLVNDIVKENFDMDVSNVPLYKVFGENIVNYIDNELSTFGSKLLGYPYFTQMDPRDANRYYDYKILLFQMDSDTYEKIMWGDLGVANFFIKDYNDFNDILYTWDCG